MRRRGARSVAPRCAIGGSSPATPWCCSASRATSTRAEKRLLRGLTSRIVWTDRVRRRDCRPRATSDSLLISGISAQRLQSAFRIFRDPDAMTEPGAVAPTCPTETAVRADGRVVRLRPAAPRAARHRHGRSRAARSSRSWAARGCGKTTLLRLIGGQLRPQRGTVTRRRARTCTTLDRDALLRAAPQDRHAVPVRRAVHRHVGVRERRVPAARAHRPAGGADPRPGADEAQRGRPARRRAADARRSCRAAWRGAWRSRAPSRSTRCSSCTTSRSPGSIRSRSASSAS